MNKITSLTARTSIRLTVALSVVALSQRSECDQSIQLIDSSRIDLRHIELQEDRKFVEERSQLIFEFQAYAQSKLKLNVVIDSLSLLDFYYDDRKPNWPDSINEYTYEAWLIVSNQYPLKYMIWKKNGVVDRFELDSRSTRYNDAKLASLNDRLRRDQHQPIRNSLQSSSQETGEPSSGGFLGIAFAAAKNAYFGFSGGITIYQGNIYGSAFGEIGSTGKTTEPNSRYKLDANDRCHDSNGQFTKDENCDGTLILDGAFNTELQYYFRSRSTMGGVGFRVGSLFTPYLTLGIKPEKSHAYYSLRGAPGYFQVMATYCWY